jgi:hypothetical protein
MPAVSPAGTGLPVAAACCLRQVIVYPVDASRGMMFFSLQTIKNQLPAVLVEGTADPRRHTAATQPVRSRPSGR